MCTFVRGKSYGYIADINFKLLGKGFLYYGNLIKSTDALCMIQKFQQGFLFLISAVSIKIIRQLTVLCIRSLYIPDSFMNCSEPFFIFFKHLFLGSQLSYLDFHKEIAVISCFFYFFNRNCISHQRDPCHLIVPAGKCRPVGRRDQSVESTDLIFFCIKQPCSIIQSDKCIEGKCFSQLWI